MKPIPEHPKYLATSSGGIFSLYTQRLLTPRRTGKGYLAVKLSTPERKTQHYVHRLVAAAFHANPEGKPFVNHKNGRKGDNRPRNLEWATAAENNAHAARFGLCPRHGIKNANSKLTEEAVALILKRLADGHSNTEIAGDVGVERSTISRIRHGNRWQHVERAA